MLEFHRQSSIVFKLILVIPATKYEPYFLDLTPFNTHRDIDTKIRIICVKKCVTNFLVVIVIKETKVIFCLFLSDNDDDDQGESGRVRFLGCFWSELLV